MLVTPNQNWVFVAEAEAAAEISARNKDFGRPVWMLGNYDARLDCLFVLVSVVPDW